MTQSSAAVFRHPDPTRLIAFWRDDLAAYEMEVQDDAPGVLTAQAGPLCLRMQADADACRIEIACEDAAQLPDYRTWLSGRMAAFDAALPPLAWTGAETAGALPPSLAVGEVAGSAPFGASWWRMDVALSAEGYDRFAGDDHWHFRLLRASSRRRAPVWPRLDANGVIRWPEGDDRPSDRVFTVRDHDPKARTITFDIYRHPGGPTCDWAATRPLGQTVGIMGPGAKTGPEAAGGGGRLIVGGDETSAPAILRALSRLPEKTPVDVVLLAGASADINEVPEPRITWLLRENGATEATLLAALRARLVGADPGTRLWFAASQSGAREIKAVALEQAKLNKRDVHAVSFWL